MDFVPGSIPQGDTSNQTRADDGHDGIRAGVLRFVAVVVCSVGGSVFGYRGLVASDPVERIPCLAVASAAAVGVLVLCVGFVRRRVRRKA